MDYSATDLMNHVGELLEGSMLAHEYRDLLDDVGSVSAIGMTSKDETLGRGEELEQAFCLSHGECLAVSPPE